MSVLERISEGIEVSEGGCWLWTGTVTENGYGRMSVDSKYVYLHRLVYTLWHGNPPEGLEVDHTCPNRHCANPSHLQLSTHKQNGENRRKLNKNNTSGVRGVSFHKAAGKWRARVRHNYQERHLGLFTDIKEAEKVVIEARLELFTNSLLDMEAAWSL